MARTTEVKWTVAGVEVAASRRATWVALCGVAPKTKKVVVRVGDPLAGTAVVRQLVELWELHELDGFALDPRSPSSTLVDPLKAEGMTVGLPDAAGVAKAHGMFIDYLLADRLRITGHPALDDAVRSAEARRLAGAAAIDRYADGTVDMAPLLAAELAVWLLGDPETAEGATPGAWVVLRSPIYPRRVWETWGTTSRSAGPGSASPGPGREAEEHNGRTRISGQLQAIRASDRGRCAEPPIGHAGP